jgi:ribosome-associated protein
VRSLTPVADYFVFCSGSSERQVKAIADAIDQKLWHKFSAHAQIEGTASATWILLDFGDIIVHVFREDIRSYYGIENMWRDAAAISQEEFEPLPIRPTQTATKPNSSYSANELLATPF